MQIRFWNSSKFNIDACIKELETQTDFDREAEAHQNFSFFPNQCQLDRIKLQSLVKELHLAEIYDKALEFYQQLLDIYENQSKDSNRDCDVA